MNDRSQRRTVRYQGRVQGVGFRYTTQSLARGFVMTGYVRNLSNGEVELVVEGSVGVLDEFFAAVATRMAGYIDRTHIQTEPATGEFDAFGIRY